MSLVRCIADLVYHQFIISPVQCIAGSVPGCLIRLSTNQCISDPNGAPQSNTSHSTRLLRSPVAPAMVVDMLLHRTSTLPKANAVRVLLGARLAKTDSPSPMMPFQKPGLRPISARLTCETVSRKGDTVPCPSHAAVDVGGVPDAVSHIPVVGGAGSVGTPSAWSQRPLDRAVAGLSGCVILLC